MKHLMFLAITLALIFTSCSGPSGSDREKNATEEVSINPDNVIQTNLEVTGMHCTDCENTIKEGISELNGIVNVTADYTSGSAEVSFDSALTSIAEITKAIENRGYGVAGTSPGNSDMVKPE